MTLGVSSLLWKHLVSFSLAQFYLSSFVTTLRPASDNAASVLFSQNSSWRSQPDCYLDEGLFKTCDVTTINLVRLTNETFSLQFTAYNNIFKCAVREDVSLFRPGMRVIVKSESKDDIRNLESEYIVFAGVATNDSSTWCHGAIVSGAFNGVVHTATGIFYVEPAERYSKTAANLHNKHIVYRDIDVKHSVTEQSFRYDILSNTPFSKHDFPLNPQELHLLSVHSDGEHLFRVKRNANSPISCSLTLVADHLFFKYVGGNSVAGTVAKIAVMVKEADSIFRSTDIDGDGASDNLGFVITDITIYTDATTPGYKLHSSIVDDVEYLETFSEYDFSGVCLALALTYRDFDNGVVGLAWVASSSLHSYPGGICQQRIFLLSKMKSYSFNTLIMTFVNNGRQLPLAETISTLAHELGHSFGSPHDRESDKICTPGGKLGNFIMYPYSLDDTKPNHRRFSSCSRAYMNPVLANKGNCLVNHPGPVCGNGLVERGEECDCGSAASCSLVDACCTPSDAPSSSVDPPCFLKRHYGHTCSPRVSPCCNQSCVTVPVMENFVCRSETDCSLESVCDGVTPACPDPEPRPNGTMCADGKLYCLSGQCQTSICKIYGLLDCMCSNEDQLCRVCCTDGSSMNNCHVIDFYLWQMNITSTNHTRNANVLPGRPCRNHQGYCDVNGECVAVDSDSAFERFTDIFGIHTAQGIGTWLKYNWFYLLLGLVAFVLLMVVFWVNAKCYKNTDIHAKRTGNLMQLLSEADHQKKRIKERLVKYDNWREEEKTFAPPTRNTLDRVAAVSRLLMLFPTLSSEEVSKVSERVTSEETAVRYLLLRGHPFVKIVSFPDTWKTPKL